MYFYDDKHKNYLEESHKNNNTYILKCVVKRIIKKSR
jgi:hypothetical protein